MSFVPLFIEMEGKKVLIVGGGKVAFRKANKLIKAGALVTLISPEFKENFVFSENLQLFKKKITQADIRKDFAFAFIATNSPLTNKEVASWCKANKILFNRVDDLDKSDFASGNQITKDKIEIGIFSSGCPIFSQYLATKIEQTIDEKDIQLLNLIKKTRKTLKECNKAPKERSKLLSIWFKPEKLSQLKQTDIKQLEEEINKCLFC
jgi:siroheme synthase-like protein